MVERNPWWRNVAGPFPKWDGPIGCKEDGGGSHKGRGTVGKMLIHRAANNHDKEGALHAILPQAANPTFGLHPAQNRE